MTARVPVIASPAKRGVAIQAYRTIQPKNSSP